MQVRQQSTFFKSKCGQKISEEAVLSTNLQSEEKISAQKRQIVPQTGSQKRRSQLRRGRSFHRVTSEQKISEEADRSRLWQTDFRGHRFVLGNSLDHFSWVHKVPNFSQRKGSSWSSSVGQVNANLRERRLTEWLGKSVKS